jgi:hypothetical protein
MNVGRLALAAIVATIIDAVYGFLVYGTLLASRFAALPGIYRQAETAPTYMPFIFVGSFLAMLAASYIYAKGYEGGSALKEGLGFGLAIGLFAAGYASIINYATLNIPSDHGMAMAAAAFVEWILAGIVIAVIYKPSATRAAGYGGRV